MIWSAFSDYMGDMVEQGGPRTWRNRKWRYGLEPADEAHKQRLIAQINQQKEKRGEKQQIEVIFGADTTQLLLACMLSFSDRREGNPGSTTHHWVPAVARMTNRRENDGTESKKEFV